MTYKKFKILYTLVLFTPYILFSQDTNLNKFKTTISVGKPPLIFTTPFEDKVTESVKDAKKVNKENREDFAKHSNYALNNLLKSGIVLFGDPMTKYVEKVAANLLKNEPGLRRKLSFYVLKTNTTNALCTDPGVIFITTGLISQIENEAQLAYIIAHEIVHYQEKHLQRSFTKSKESELNSNNPYEDLILLSKDHEFEADKNALKLYNEAGYSDKEVNTVFDVLMYSYLTFDEIEIDTSFFGNPEIYIPLSLFPEKANPIMAFEDYDDSKSTHPNIRKRKEAIAEEIKKYSNWKSNESFIGKEEFKRVQTIARFESVRENLLVANYIRSLYEIYILEKEFPSNEYLQTSKAIAWASINQISLSGRKRSLTSKMNEKEGGISILYGLLNNLNQVELSLLCMRQVEDVYIKFPSSKRISELRIQTIGSMTRLRNLKIENLEKVSYPSAQRFNNRSSDENTTNNTDIKNNTKYDRIRRIRKQQYSSHGATIELSDENFSLFLLYDLANDKKFHEIYQTEKEKYNQRRYSRSNSNDTNKDNKHFQESDILLVTPQIVSEIKGKFDLEATFLFRLYLNKGIEKHAPKDRLKKIELYLSEEFTTEKYNEVALINAFLIQLSNLENLEIKNYCIDYEQINNLISQYNDPCILLISGSYYYDKFTSKAVTGNARYIHIASGKIFTSREYDSRYKLGRLSVEGLTHMVFSRFN